MKIGNYELYRSITSLTIERYYAMSCTVDVLA